MSKFDITQYFSHVFLFEGLTLSERERMALKSTIKRYRKNVVLFGQGDKADAFYIVVNGKLSVFRVSGSGEEQVIHIHNDGEVVAEAAIFDKLSYPASCKTLKESLLIRVPKDDFQQLIISNPKISLKMMASYSKRLREFVTMVEYLSLDSIRLRLLKYLNRHQVKEGENWVVRLGVTKKELSQLLGTVPETLSRNIASLRNEGIITEKNGCFVLLNEKQIRKLLAKLG